MRTYEHLVIGVVAVAALGLAVAGCPKGSSGGDGGGAGVTAGSQLTILYSSNNDGEIEPCG